MSLTLNDLRVHYRPEDGLPNQIKQRRVTLADLIEVLESEGAELWYSLGEDNVERPYLALPL